MMRLFNTLLVAAAAFLGAFTAISRHHPPEPAPQPSTVVQYVTDPTVCRIALRTQEAKR